MQNVYCLLYRQSTLVRQPFGSGIVIVSVDGQGTSTGGELDGLVIVMGVEGGRLSSSVDESG